MVGLSPNDPNVPTVHPYTKFTRMHQVNENDLKVIFEAVNFETAGKHDPGEEGG